jgi:hypothetical protein
MRRLSIKLEKSRIRTGWYYFSTIDKEIKFIVQHDIPGLYFFLKNKEYECSLPVKKNVLIKERLSHFKGCFRFEYHSIETSTELCVDILA